MSKTSDEGGSHLPESISGPVDGYENLPKYQSTTRNLDGKMVKYEKIVRHGDPHPDILSTWHQLLSLPIPCHVHWQLPCCLDGARSAGVPGKAGFRAINQNGRGPTTECVVGVWVVRGVRTRSARVAGVNASFETTGTGIVCSGGSAEGGRVSVISGGRSITGILV